MTYKEAARGNDIGYWEELEKHYKSVYERQVEENNASAAASTEKTLREIGEKINAINREYREKNRELYRGYRDAQIHMDEKMAAAGYTGGLSESGHIALRSGYEKSVSELESRKSGDVAALRAQGAQAESDYRAAADKANAAAGKNYRNQLVSAAKLRRSEMQKDAATLAAAGDFSGYARLGYSAEEIGKMREAWEMKNPKVAMGLAAAGKSYNSVQVAALTPLLAQHYLAALGYRVKISGVWDSATERAYRSAFGRGSGRM